jgi:hypothetical protein
MVLTMNTHLLPVVFHEAQRQNTFAASFHTISFKAVEDFGAYGYITRLIDTVDLPRRLENELPQTKGSRSD